MEHGVKPVWVFDGKCPEEKQELQKKRQESKDYARAQKESAIADGDFEKARKMSGRSIQFDPEVVSSAKLLAELMGVPVVHAPSEGEAQCAALVKQGLAYATASEDMDSLTLGSSYLLRGFNSQKSAAVQIDLEVMLEEFKMDMDQFTDLCILCGCDYTGTIGQIGHVRAFSFISQYKTIEKVIENLPSKYEVPELFEYQKARELFKNPDVFKDPVDLKWKKHDATALKDFLVEQKGFKEKTVDNGIARLDKF